ncbi:MAG: HAD-IC family P-type ATPase [Bacilli bacterium]
MEGLTRQEVEYRKNNGLSNDEKVKYTRTAKEIVLSNTITLFNILNISLVILVLTTGSIQNITFIGTAIFNTIIAIYQELKAKKTLDNIRVTNQEKVTVVRDGKKEEISKEEIVLGDTIYLSSGDNILVDLEVLKSSSLEVDESIITGESNAIQKRKDDKILSGSIVTSGTAYAKVISLSKDSYASSLVKDAASVKDNTSYLQNTINKILKIITFLIIPVGILLFISQYFYSKQSYSGAILSTVAGIIGMIPEGLVLLTSIALTAGVVKMAKKKVLIQKLHGIEILSCTDVLCLDKTGTITDGTMEVIDTVVLNNKINIDDIIANINTEEGNNATDIALKKKYGIKNNLNVTDRAAFSSSKKCSITQIDDTKYYLGALEYITDKKLTDYTELTKYILKGYRIITLASGNTDIKVDAFIILKDNVRENAKDTLNYFKQQDVEIKIISGDNPVTVSNILRQLEFDGYDRFIEGKDLPKDYNELVKVVKEITIFGRMTPSQKQIVIKALKENNTVSMIGDGVNDILALKEADCGIALGSGVQAAKSVSEVVLTNNDFSTLPGIVNEGRRVVNNIERVASMYLIKTTYSLLLSLVSIILAYEYPFYPIQLSLISAICVGIPSFFLALEPNYNKVGKDFIINVFRNALPNGIMVVLNIFIIIMFCSIFGKDFDNYRLVIVSLTGLITLRLLYTICKPLNLWRKILLIFCSISFFELLILLPDLFLVSKFGIVNVIFILVLGFIDTYVIDFLRDIYDKIINKVRKVVNERKKRKEENKLF